MGGFCEEVSRAQGLAIWERGRVAAHSKALLCHNTIMVYMELVNIDKAGRIVIPGALRKKLKLNESSKLLIDVKNDLLIIKKINIEELAEQLEKDFKNIDIDMVVGKVRSGVKEKIRKKHPSVFG